MTAQQLDDLAVMAARMRECVSRPSDDRYEALMDELRDIMTCTADPFGIDHDCTNPSGHQFVATCSDVVCFHCARIAWQ